MKILYCIVFVMLLAGCGREAYPHKFNIGQFVCIKLTGERAMVIGAALYGNRVSVRVQQGTKRDGGGLFTRSVSVPTSYAEVRMLEYELEECHE